jgi:hypothetical protein
MYFHAKFELLDRESHFSGAIEVAIWAATRGFRSVQFRGFRGKRAREREEKREKLADRKIL